MARGQRKSAKEKLMEAYNKVQLEIEQCEVSLENKKTEKSELEAKMKELELSELSGVLDNYGISIQEVKDLIEASVTDSRNI